jgi:hypothetical protein
MGLGLLVAFVLVAFAPGSAMAEKKMHACSLLNAGEVSRVAGAEVGKPHESDIVIPSGPSKGETMGMCAWQVGQATSVSLAVIRAPHGPGREAGLAKLRKVFDGLKAKGWREEKKDYPGAKCVVMTPPPSEERMPRSTACFGEAKGMGISVGANATATRFPPEKVKELLDKVIGRL